MKSYVIGLCRLEITLESDATGLGTLNAMGIVGNQGGGHQVAALRHQRQSGCDYCHGQQSPSSTQNILTHRELWLWLVYHGVWM